MDAYFDGVWWVRACFQRGLAAVYFFAFLSAWNQFPALLGERGLLPVPRYLERGIALYANTGEIEKALELCDKAIALGLGRSYEAKRRSLENRL